MMYWRQGKYAEAEGLYNRALAIYEKARNTTQPVVARILHNLAIVYKEQGKYAEAEALYKRALEIKEKALGADHPSVAMTLNNLAVLYQGQAKDALMLKGSMSGRWPSRRRYAGPWDLLRSPRLLPRRSGPSVRGARQERGR